MTIVTALPHAGADPKAHMYRETHDPFVLLRKLQAAVNELLGPMPTVNDRLNCAAVLRALADTLETEVSGVRPPPPPQTPPTA